MYSILRRYFAMNAFDGAVTTLGEVMGFFIADVSDVRVVLLTVLATAFAFFISGVWSAYLTEKAERTYEIIKLEKKLLHSLKNSRMASAVRLIALEAALVNGSSPALVALFIAIPFFFTQLSIIPIQLAFYFSIALALLVLVFLGFFLAVISKQSKPLLAAKMLFAGLLAIGFSLFLEML
ncbi:MAG: hypothetical protein J7L44_02745 [Candidatus Diapherotrites archaeon]|nr:hypothetical protein [Candidatus Diapherotrites archaeon]